MLRGQDHGVDPDRLAVFVAERDLALAVRPQVVASVVGCPPHLALALDQFVRVIDRSGHQHVGFIGRITEHQALVAGALLLGKFSRDALVNVGGLLADDVDHGTGVAVETDLRRVVADVHDDPADQFFQVDPGAGRDLAADNGHAGFDKGFAGDMRCRVLLDDGVEDGIGNLVRNLVRMAFGHRFGGK